MGRKQGSRKGSMMYWPRVTSSDFLPEVNWKPLVAKPSDKVSLLGFIAYKAGMKSAYVKDNTPDSMMKNKRTIVPVTLLECPTIKILSVRFYKFKKILKDILNDNLDKELGRQIKLPNKRAS
jgi:large subunit ribosomal protein L3